MFLWNYQRFFIAGARGVFTKLLAVAEGSIKVKVKLHWTLFAICLIQHSFEIKDFCMETRLHNILKTEILKYYNVGQDHLGKPI